MEQTIVLCRLFLFYPQKQATKDDGLFHFHWKLKFRSKRADIISVNICWKYFMIPLMLVGAVALAQEAPKKITRGEALAALVTKVQPDYPAVAKQLKIGGSVELEATVSEQGEVTKVEIVKGNPLLTASAVQAVKRWKFKPFLEDGKAVPVVAPIVLDFKL